MERYGDLGETGAAGEGGEKDAPHYREDAQPREKWMAYLSLLGPAALAMIFVWRALEWAAATLHLWPPAAPR